ncbi:MAG: PQQ-binding-like beta-propeller repeat protein [Candidatus Bathyarchaeia archaeon]|jgi:outer membrane protein assembly factor BamB
MSKKVLSSILAMLFIVSIATSIIALPNPTAAATGAKTYPFVEAVPNPVGVNQRTLINFGLLNYLMVDGDGWNVTLTITDPDGKTTTVDRMTWSTGTVGYSFVPEKTGTYILKCSFKESWYNSTYMGYFGPASISQYMASSETEPYELIVTEDPKPIYPGHSMPTEYWSRPIDSQLREWWSVSGSWVAAPDNLYAPYNDAPETAHILWTKPIGDTMGGLIGGDSEMGYQNGDAYEGKWAGSIIISGVLYYNRYTSSFYSTAPKQEVVAVDLHTGEVLWEKVLDSNGRIATGQILKWDCLNNRGGFSYIWVSSGSNMYAFEALTGDWLYNFTNVPGAAAYGGATTYYGPNGELLKYFIQGNRLLRWNSSYVVNQGKTGMAESWGSQIQGMSFNASKYDLNVSISGSIPSTSILQVYPGDRIIGGNYTVGAPSGNGITLWGIDLSAGHEGTVLFSKTWNAPADWANLAGTMQSYFTAYSQEDYVGVFWAKEERINYGFSLKTGDYLWKTEPQYYADAWTDSPADERNIAYGKLYSASCGGIVYCFDITNGKTLWTYNVTDKYTESYITNNWWLITTFISDGKIYLGHMEHSALEPKPRGAPFICLNAETGELIWEIDGAFRQTRWGGRAIIGDSIIVTQDTYDQQIYAIGKGPSAMTVTAPDAGVTTSSAVMIRGTITDVSPGTTDSSIAMRFPNGVPVVSDESQSDWMLYVYKQFEQPGAATGVPISIDAIDPNGNYVHLGDAVSDASGRFHLSVCPETPGDYVIYATFGGSAAYYSSFAQTEMTVMNASEPTPEPSQTTQTPYELYTIGSAIVIIIAIALVAVLLLRKRP